MAFHCQWCKSENLMMEGSNLVCKDCNKTCWHGGSHFVSLGVKNG